MIVDGENRGFRQRLRMLMRMTAFRLTLIFFFVFLVFSVALVTVSLFTVTTVLHREARSVINEELVVLRRTFKRGGVRGLVRAVDQRSRAPGASLYLVVDQQGRVFAGNVQRLPTKVLERDRWIHKPFKYELLAGMPRARPPLRRNGSNPSDRPEFDREELDQSSPRAAIARVVFLENGLTLLVGRDFGQPSRFRSIVLGTLIFTVLSLAVIALVSWYFLGRRALRRIEKVSKASQRIVAGDLAQRLPETGTGDEFDRLSSALNSMLEKIENLDGGIKDMADSVAHDLKTPLTRLRNRAEAALVPKEGLTSEAYREALEDTISQSDQLIRIFNALLMISRVEAGSQAGSLEPVDMKMIVEDIGELYEAVTEESGATFDVSIQPNVSDWTMNGNRELLGQAVSNLIENALKYGGKSSVDDDGNVTNLTSISLLLRRRGAHIHLVVEDNGPGIPAEDRDRVKRRFVRLEKSRTKPGSGLGLSMVNAVSKLHGGRLVLEDNKPGLRAYMELPSS